MKSQTLLAAAIAIYASLLTAASAADPQLGFALTLDRPSAYSQFYVTLENTGRTRITGFELPIGDGAFVFDEIDNFSFKNKAGATVALGQTLVSPGDGGVNAGANTKRIVFSFTSFDPGERISFQVDIDGNSKDFRSILFNNGDKQNSVVSVTGLSGEVLNLTLPDGPANNPSYVFEEGVQARVLRVKSVVEAKNDLGQGEGPVFVAEVTVKVNGDVVQDAKFVDSPLGPATGEAVGREIEIDLFEGDTVEITAPKAAYRDISGRKLIDSALNDPDQIREKAEERFTTIGISVNEVPQTGDPTLYRFDVESDTTNVVVKWQHDYALRIRSDFSDTASDERDADGGPWAGPLNSQDNGNPEPAAGELHWIEKDTQVPAQIDGQYIDQFAHPGLDIRYVPYAFIAYGPPNTRTTQDDDLARFVVTDDTDPDMPTVGDLLVAERNTNPNSEFDAPGNTDTEKKLRQRFDLDVRQSPEPRYLLNNEAFTMYGPAEIRYFWKIQFGVSVNVAGAGEPKIVVPGGEDRTGEGVFWFDEGTELTVASAARESTALDSQALTGWIAGDGFYFASQGTIDGDGDLDGGNPTFGSGDDEIEIAEWRADATGDGTLRGMYIDSLRRPAKVLWRYGDAPLRERVTVGEYVFQGNAARAELFSSEPAVQLDGAQQGAAEQTVWDPIAKKLFPLVGGPDDAPSVIRVDWIPRGLSEPLEIIVEARWPDPAHYPHVAGTPAVALDPDPNDDFLFKELKYSTNNAVIDDEKRFTAPGPGMAVLLFSEIQRGGRGQPREFLQVRVAETKTLADVNPTSEADVEVVIGDKVTDLAFDRAQLGTGYVVGSDADPRTKARYNPFIYNPAKLVGIAARDVYDTDLLFSDSAHKVVVNKAALPGPIIPVNLSLQDDQIIQVVWYEDPATHDGLLWPHDACRYAPRWPVAGTFTDSELDAVSDGEAGAAGRIFARLSGASSIALVNQTAYVTSAPEDALSIIDIGDPTAFRLLSESVADSGAFGSLGGASSVVVAGGLAFVAAPDDDAVTIIDVSNPVVPTEVAVIDGMTSATSLAVAGELLFIGGADAVTIVGISDPAQPVILATADAGSGFDSLGGVAGLAVSGGVLYVVSATDAALTLVDVSDPAVPRQLGTLAGLGGAAGVVVNRGHAFVPRTGGVTIIDVTDPAMPLNIGMADTTFDVSSVAIAGDLLYVASAANSAVFNIGDRSSPAFIEEFNRPANSLAIAGGLLYQAGGTAADLAVYAVADDRLGRIVIASQWGSESEDSAGRDQLVVPAIGPFERATTYDPSRLQQVQIYNQPVRDDPGYNPNEEHALMAPSLRFAQVSPRPLAAYALRDNDLNVVGLDAATHTSLPRVLVQYFDAAEEEFKMNVYTVQKEDMAAESPRAQNSRFGTFYQFAAIDADPTAAELAAQPFVRMEAGEPVIPFYPIGFVDGAVPCPNTYGTDLLPQKTYWEDHRGSNWAVSGGNNAWFSVSPHYRLSPNFWWPSLADGQPKPGQLVETRSENDDRTIITAVQKSAAVGVGDCVSFLPTDIDTLLDTEAGTTVRTIQIPAGDGIDVAEPVETSVYANILPTRILYKSDWPDVAPVLKAGETLTFSGGEFRADHPTMEIADFEGNIRTVDTPGLPQLTAFASAEVVFDSLNPAGQDALYKSSWTARVAQVLDVRRVEFPVEKFPAILQPANGKTRVSGGMYLFVDLPASLQKRVRYNPLSQFVDAQGLTRTGKLEIIGLLNDKGIGDATLTAAPPAVYVLEPNILTPDDVAALKKLVVGASSEEITEWGKAVDALFRKSRNPNGLTDPTDYAARPTATPPYWVGLEGKVVRDSVTGEALLEPLEGADTETTEDDSDVLVAKKMPGVAAPVRAFGVGLALVPNGDFMDPDGEISMQDGDTFITMPYPDVSWVTVVENNDPSLGGSPITPHVIKVDRTERYRGAIKTVESDNVFDENLVLRHTGDFGTNAGDLVFEWWYRPDSGALNVPPPDLLEPGETNPWKVFPDDTGKRGQGRYEVTLKGNPNAPEALIADTWWYVRYRHVNDEVDGTDWGKTRPVGTGDPFYTWAGAGNSQPFEDFDLNGLPDFRAQLAQGWIKRVLDAVNPYEARIRDFNGDNPATVSSMLQQLGPRFEGPVALNPAKNVIENVGLIELYETILKRGRDLTIDLSRPVASPAIANALQLASTRISDFYNLLANEAYTDALDPTIGFGSDSVEYGSLAPTVFAFQNQLSSSIEEELALLSGVDYFFARPVYNRLFWNFTKGEGEAAYAVNYNITDINQDGFIDEDDAMILFPQGHGDAWGHYLTALRNQYELLQHPFFNWVSRSEFYNLQDIVIKVDFLDERKFAQTAAAKAKAGAEIVDLTYRQKYVEDPEAQWQGYTDSNADRAAGVQGWARRAAQGAYFDWVTANALLPAVHPDETLEGIQKVDRSTNSDISVISANLNRIQRTFDEANDGYNPLGVAAGAVPFDVDPEALDGSAGNSGVTHFEQIYARAVKALQNASATWDNANQTRNMLRKIGNSEREFRNKTFQEDLTYKNRLIKIFGKPYEGTIGPGSLYPAGYDGPDLSLYMYVKVREIKKSTVPGPTLQFARFEDGVLVGNDPDTDAVESELFEAFRVATGGEAASDGEAIGIGAGVGAGAGFAVAGPGGAIVGAGVGAGIGAAAGEEDDDISDILDENYASVFAPTWATINNAANFNYAEDTTGGLFAVNYTDLTNPKVPLENLKQIFPVKAAGYTFQAPNAWGGRGATGELQLLINQMIQQEARVAEAIGKWDGLQGGIVRELRIISARLESSGSIRERNKQFQTAKFIADSIIKALETAKSINDLTTSTVVGTISGLVEAIPENLPTAGLAVSPGDGLAPGRSGFVVSQNVTKTVGDTAGRLLEFGKLVEELAISAAELGVNFSNENDELELNKKEWLKGIEDLAGDEPVLRIGVFREIEKLRELSDRYRSLLDEGIRLIDERQAFNKRVAAQTQRNRYQDMTFRVSRNHALQTYNDSREIAAKYAYLAAKAYDYETNFAASDPGSPQQVFNQIVQARGLGLVSGGQPQFGKGGIAASLAWLKTNFDSQKGQLGFNNPQTETGKMSLRSEMMRLLPHPGPPVPPVPTAADFSWTEALQDARVDDLWEVPEFRYHCRPFAPELDTDGNRVAQPGIVLRFGTQIIAGENFFGKPLSGGDQAYDPSNFATKIRSAGIWFSDYQSEVWGDLPEAPRVYLIPVGIDIMNIPTAGAAPGAEDERYQRLWNVIDQSIPVPLPADTADLDNGSWIPLLDSLNGRLGNSRKFSSFRAYHNGSNAVNTDQLVFDSRLIGRSAWNTEWVMIIPGLTLNEDANIGLDRFIQKVTDIKLVFQTYGYSGG